ncbi:ABC transporter ATP-binding protein [Frateuria aurantia]
MRERFQAMRLVPRYLASIWQTSPGLTVLEIVLRLLSALAPVAILAVGKLIIDAVVAWLHGGAASHPLPPGWSLPGRVGWLLLAELGLALATEWLNRGISLIDGLLVERYNDDTSLRLMRHAATLDLSDFEDAGIQDRLDRARRQVAGRSNLLPTLAGQVENLVTMASFAVGLAVYSPWLLLLILVSLLPTLAGELHFGALAYQTDFDWTQQQRELDYVRMLGASTQGAKEIKSFGLNPFLIERYHVLAREKFRLNRVLAWRRAGWRMVYATLGTLGYYLAYAWIIWRTLHGSLGLGDLTFLAASFRRLQGLLQSQLTSFSQVAGQALYLKDLFSFFELRPKIVSPAQPRPFPQPIRQGFRFEQVGMRYPGSSQWALRHLDLSIDAGEVIALVGENGAGKTSLVKLLARLYVPDEGRILLDGHDLSEYSLEDLRAHVGIIFQDYMRYHFSAADNIAMGRIDARDDRARISEAARRSLADSVIEGLEGGYDQMLGKLFHEGVELSGGQWQKIAIARAYIRDAQLLILDEPTSALDARAEAEVFERFKALTEGRSAVIISHRFSTVRIADRIVVLQRGRVLESGSHEALMARGGHYAELFELQAAGYR